MIRTILDLYILVLIVDVIISYIPSVKYQPWAKTIHKVSEFTCKPVRQILPPDLPMDPSPMIVIIGINLLKLLW
jgi:YggT family protein